ncbi:hypothetical protein QFZ99_006664 [Paraburkholderia atlantica]
MPSDNDSLPSSCAYDASVAVKVLLTEPSSNSVSRVTGLPVCVDATPVVVHVGLAVVDHADRHAGDMVLRHQRPDRRIDGGLELRGGGLGRVTGG